jgi:hypothetical protein
MTMKHKYSKKVRILGYVIIAFELLTAVTWFAAWYGNGMVLMSIQRLAFGGGSQSFGFVNSTGGKSLTVPVTGGGFFPVTVSASLLVLNSQNQTLSQVQSSVTVSPGETKNLTLTVPNSVISSSSPLSNYYLHISLEIMSLYNLVSIGAKIELNTSVFSGGSKS